MRNNDPSLQKCPADIDLRRVAAGAPAWLAPGGHLLSETSERQAAGAAAVLTASGLTARITSSAELAATVVIGARPA